MTNMTASTASEKKLVKDIQAAIGAAWSTNTESITSTVRTARSISASALARQQAAQSCCNTCRMSWLDSTLI